jgi:hypothetical protein
MRFRVRGVTRALDNNTKTNNNHSPDSDKSVGGRSSDLEPAPSNVMASAIVVLVSKLETPDVNGELVVLLRVLPSRLRVHNRDSFCFVGGLHGTHRFGQSRVPAVAHRA